MGAAWAPLGRGSPGLSDTAIGQGETLHTVVGNTPGGLLLL